MRYSMKAIPLAGELCTCGKGVLSQFIVAVGVVLALCSYGRSEELALDGEAVLRKSAKAYETLQTYKDETTLVTNVTALGTQQRIETRYSLAVERPNKLALVLESGSTGLTLVSDGINLYTYVPMVKEYTVQQAPASLEEILRDGVLGPGMRMAGEGAPMILPLFGHDPYKAVMEGVEQVDLIGDEVLEETRTYHLLLHQRESDVDLWIDAQNYLFRKIRIDMAKVLERQGQFTPEATQMKLVVEETHAPIRVGATIPRDTFVFTPPEGAKETDDFFAETVPPQAGKKAPDFTLEGIEEGSSIHLADYEGKVVMLDFWASWCPPCRYEMPVLQQVYDEYKDKGLILIAVNVGEDRNTAERFLTKDGYTFPVALDTTGKVESLYGVPGLPTLILIGKQGTIQGVHVGFAPGLKIQLEEELDKLLAEEPLAGD